MVRWLERLPLDVEYRGERLPALALSVFLALLKAKRRTPSAEEQKKLLEQHDNKCAVCDGLFDGDLCWDHVAPLRQLTRLAPQRFQPICAICHKENPLTPWRHAFRSLNIGPMDISTIVLVL